MEECHPQGEAYDIKHVVRLKLVSTNELSERELETITADKFPLDVGAGIEKALGAESRIDGRAGRQGGSDADNPGLNVPAV